ncbi:MAG: hypothetical protein OER88_13180 [Planctomycetota bacterium]|nr:hypothetical protein [Planctomycetota bacterium]
MATFLISTSTPGGSGFNSASAEMIFPQRSTIVTTAITASGHGSAGQTAEAGISEFSWGIEPFNGDVNFFSNTFGHLSFTAIHEKMTRVTMLVRCYDGWAKGTMISPPWF